MRTQRQQSIQPTSKRSRLAIAALAPRVRHQSPTDRKRAPMQPRCGSHLARLARHAAACWQAAPEGAAGSSSSGGGRCFASSSCSAAAAAPRNAMALVKELRQTSGAPISDVKASLEAAGWDVAAALEALRLKGLAAAVKKASRHASEGLVAVAQQGRQLVSVVEINSETDFVGRSGPFQQLLAAAARAALSLAPPGIAGAAPQVLELDVKQLAAAPLPDGGSSVEEGCALLTGQVRENISLRRGYLVSAGPNGVVSSYVHMPVAPGAGRIAAVVSLGTSGAVKQQALQQLAALASDLAMHSAGLHTQYVDRAAMPAAVLDAMRADFAAQTAEQMPGKPDGVVAKIVDGKVAKWCKEYCLLEQKFLLDDATTVKALLDARARELSLPGPLAVSGLLRLQVGEGLERADSKPDFAAEVAAMAGGQ